MQIQQRIQAFVQLGLFIQVHFLESSTDKDLEWFEKWEKVKKEAYTYNNWFIPKFVQESIMNIAEMLNEKELNQFASVFKTDKNPKTVAIICAGNIPMVAFHDIMMTLLSGNKALVKTSSDDPILIPFLFRLLIEIEPQFKDFISFADGKLEKFDAVIATGSNNTSSHFEYYFSKYPNIIRKNRSSVAVLNGDESDEELKALGKDVFSYFGLGCRNVSQLLVPENYNFDKFFEAIFDFGFVIENKKYGNNYDYNRAVYLMGQNEFLDNNFLILKPDNQIHAPISVLFYFNYKSSSDITDFLKNNENQIQCIVGKEYTPFGNSQCPVITDYADNINTAEFLVNL